MDVQGNGSARLFVALEIARAVRAALVEVPALVGASGFRLVGDAQLHLTLRFLGDVPVEGGAEAGARHAALAEALARAVAAVPAFDVELRGAGTFGKRGAPHVLWAGVHDPGAQLAALAGALDAALDPIVGARDRPFRPHVTLGRGRRGARVTQLRAVGALGAVRVAEAVLFESVMPLAGGGGPVHVARARARLAGCWRLLARRRRICNGPRLVRGPPSVPASPP